MAISQRRRDKIRTLSDAVRRTRPPSENEEGPEERIVLADALRRLPSKDAALIVLRHQHGCSNRELAAALGVPESTVSARLVSAKRRLRAQLECEP